MSFSDMEEVFRFAITKEQEAQGLYERAARMAPDPKTRRLLEALADDEREHRVLLATRDIGKITEETTWTESLASLASDLVDIPFREGMDYAEIFVFGIQEEDRAYRLYTGLGHVREEGSYSGDGGYPHGVFPHKVPLIVTESKIY